jgi:hypothetical protein
MRSEIYNKRNDLFCVQDQQIAESVYLFRIKPPKSGLNPC